jgi:hypothetical protein
MGSYAVRKEENNMDTKRKDIREDITGAYHNDDYVVGFFVSR